MKKRGVIIVILIASLLSCYVSSDLFFDKNQYFVPEVKFEEENEEYSSWVLFFTHEYKIIQAKKQPLPRLF